jgi:hypothetical protein
LGKSSPNIAWPITRQKNNFPRSLEVPTSGECATGAERMVTLPTRAQVWRWAVALTVTGQTGACHPSDRCWPGLPPLKWTSQRWPPLQEQGSKASMENKLQGMMWPTRTEDAFAMNAIKRVTWAKIIQMVTFLNKI